MAYLHAPPGVGAGTAPGGEMRVDLAKGILDVVFVIDTTKACSNSLMRPSV